MFDKIEIFKTKKFKTLLIVIFAMFVDAMSYGLIVPLLPVYSDKIFFQSNLKINIFIITYAISIVIIIPFVNLISKKFGNKKSLFTSGLLLILSSFLFLFGNNFEILLIARFLQGSSAAITWTCGLSLIANNISPKNRSTALASAMFGVTIGHLISAPFAGYLYRTCGLHFPFFVIGILSILSSTFLFFLQKEPYIFKDKKYYKNKEFIILIYKNKLLIGLSGIILLESFIISYLEPSLTLHISRYFNVSNEIIGSLFSIHILALGIFSPIITKFSDKYGKIKFIAIGIFAIGIIFLFMSTTHSLIYFFILMSALGIACAFSVSPVLSTFADEIDKSEMKGVYHLAYSFLNFIYSLGMITGPGTNFIMNEFWSTQTSFAFVGFLLISSTFLFIIYMIFIEKHFYNPKPSSIIHPHSLEQQKDKSQDFSIIS